MSEGLFEHRELGEEGNPTPQAVTEGFGYVTEFLSSYGWFILLGLMGLLYLRGRYGSQVHQWQQKREQNATLSQYDAAAVLSRQEAMDRARQRMQEEHDSKSAEYAERQKQKEEQKRKEQVEEWERHKQGKGYRSKRLNKEESQPSGEAAASGNQNKPKKPPLRGGFNPLMGGTGSGFRPARSLGRRGGG